MTQQFASHDTCELCICDLNLENKTCKSDPNTFPHPAISTNPVAYFISQIGATSYILTHNTKCRISQRETIVTRTCTCYLIRFNKRVAAVIRTIGTTVMIQFTIQSLISQTGTTYFQSLISQTRRQQQSYEQ